MDGLGGDNAGPVRPSLLNTRGHLLLDSSERRVKVHRVRTLALLWAACVARTLVATEPSPIHLPVAIAVSLLPLRVGDIPGTVLHSPRAALCYIFIYIQEIFWRPFSIPGGAAICLLGTVLHSLGTVFHHSGPDNSLVTILCPPEPQGRPQIT